MLSMWKQTELFRGSGEIKQETCNSYVGVKQFGNKHGKEAEIIYKVVARRVVKKKCSFWFNDLNRLTTL